MECPEKRNTEKYLRRFDEILYGMASKMLSACIRNNITLDFIRCMIPHHQAAIYMCENLLEYTDYDPLEEIARRIITMQTSGIRQMREIANTTEGYINPKQDVNCYLCHYLSITKKMICRMKNSPRDLDINLNFVNEMIPHHEGAIAMCENLLEYCIDPRLIQVAETIITEQSNGVKQLEEIKNFLCKNKNI